MIVLVATPPERAVSLALAKQHIEVDGGDRDDLIGTYIDGAIGQLDGPDGWLGRALGRQTLEAQIDGFTPHNREQVRHHHSIAHPWDFIPLPYPPLVSVESVKYDDPDGAEQTLDPAAYRLTPKGLLRLGAAAWPPTAFAPGCVRIRYVAGYEALPAAIATAVLMMVGDAFENRQTTDVGRVAKIPMSMMVESLLSPYRVWSA